LVTIRPGKAFENLTEESREKINFDNFFRPAGFPILDVMPQDITFPLKYFIAQVLTLFHQHRMSVSQDAARRKFNVHFDHSGCCTARFLAHEMAKLRGKRVGHPLYSPDLAIYNFYLFSHRKDKLTGFHADQDAELL
jgi:hypothetical protein